VIENITQITFEIAIIFHLKIQKHWNHIEILLFTYDLIHEVLHQLQT